MSPSAIINQSAPASIDAAVRGVVGELAAVLLVVVSVLVVVSKHMSP